MTVRGPRRPRDAKAPEASDTVARAFRHLAAAMAHEVRNPLNAMAIHLELVESRARRVGGSDGEALVRSSEVLRREVVRIDHLLEEYLRHVGPRDGHRTRVALADLVSAAVDRATPAALLQKVTLEPVLESGAASWPLDPEAISLLLDQVITNAVEASSKNSAVSIRVQAISAVGVVEVIDRGEGIAADTLPHIFALGFTTRRDRPGLGLAVAKQIVKEHGGSIAAFSDGPGRGARIRIELPLE